MYQPWPVEARTWVLAAMPGSGRPTTIPHLHMPGVIRSEAARAAPAAREPGRAQQREARSDSGRRSFARPSPTSLQAGRKAPKLSVKRGWDAACVSCQENATLQAAGFANRLEPARRWKALEGHSAPTQAAVMPNIREDRGWGKVLAFLRASGRIRAVGATQQPTAVLASAPPSGRSRPSWSGSTPPTAASSCAPPCSWASGCLPLPPPPDREVRGGRPPSRFGAAARTP